MLRKTVWLIVNDSEIRDVHTSEEAADFLADDGDKVIPYTIEIKNE